MKPNEQLIPFLITILFENQPVAQQNKYLHSTRFKRITLENPSPPGSPLSFLTVATIVLSVLLTRKADLLIIKEQALVHNQRKINSYYMPFLLINTSDKVALTHK